MRDYSNEISKAAPLEYEITEYLRQFLIVCVLIKQLPILLSVFFYIIPVNIRPGCKVALIKSRLGHRILGIKYTFGV